MTVAQSRESRAPLRERRAVMRYGCPPGTLVLVCLPGTERHLEGWAYELSRVGMAVDVAEPLAVGTGIVVRMHSRNPHEVFLLAAKVVHVTQQTEGGWRVGCAFDEPLDLETMDALL